MGGTSASTGAPRRRLACPGVADPMATGDGWLLRVRLPGGAITPEQLEVVSAVSERWGRGVVEITARANVQIRGVATEAVEAAAEALVGAGLALPDPVVDGRRAVVAPPLTGHDRAEATGAGALLDALVQALVTAAPPGPLPPKFGVVIDTGGTIPVAAVPADLLLVAHRGADGRPGWTAVTGPRPRRLLGPVADADLVTLVVAVAERCAIHGCRAADLPAADVPATDRCAADLLAAADRCAADVGPLAGAARPPPAAVGVWPHVDPARANVVGAPVLGRLDPDRLRLLAGAGRRGLGVRLTPAGAVAVVGVPRSELDAVRHCLDAAGCSTDPVDPWPGVSACAGSDGCASARADTHAAARALVADRRATADRRPVHLSGCDKRCGAPAGARLLVADETGHFMEPGA